MTKPRKILASLGILVLAAGFTIASTWAGGVEAGTVVGLVWGVSAGMLLMNVWYDEFFGR